MFISNITAILTILLSLLTSPLLSISSSTTTSKSSNIITGCSSHCTLDFDDDLSCWNKTLKYYNHVLLEQMRQYVSAQINIAIWRHEHNIHINWNSMKNSTTDNMKSMSPKNIDDEKGLIKTIDITKIVDLLVDKAKDITTSYFTGHDISSTTIDCPHGCEHIWNPYFWMFFVSGTVNIILISISVGLVWRLDRRDTLQAKLEIAECEIVKFSPEKSDHGIGALKRKSVQSVKSTT